MLVKNVERHILRFSLITAFLFAMAGSIWGFLINSQIILFDGIYSFISVVLSGVSLFASEVIRKDDDKHFQFGRSQIEPITIVFKSLVILVICFYAFINALYSILEGGRSVSSLSAIVYSFITTFACLLCWLYVHRAKKKTKNSGLVKAESNQWLMDTLLSLGVLVGFALSYIVEGTSYGDLVRFFDPVMVIIVTLFFFKVPLLELGGAIKELLLMAPDEDLVEKIEIIVDKVKEKHLFDDRIIRTAKTGRIISLEISFVSNDTNRKIAVVELDNIREELERELDRYISYEKWLTISFIADEKWA